MKKNRLLYIIVLLQVFLGQGWAKPTDSTFQRHEVRLGWGDMLFETVAFPASSSHQWASPDALSPDYSVNLRENTKYTGHIFAEYLYKPLWWLGVGMQVDFEGIFWQEVTRDRYQNPLTDRRQVRNYNLCFLPTARFTYYNSEWVNLYSGVSAGLLVAFDNDRQREVNHCFNLNFFSVQVGHGHWAGAVELGFLLSLKDINKIYMFGSRLVSVSVSYKL